ncbi:MFS transporter small subunit [Geodermatophilus sp. CPCC 206100]|uniref:MFS transporter small subunit n=1 Tax=Geodermatophilus sp. CPCC 206100 TaxID=3020054 RepID=UPI003B0082F5
MSTPVSQQSADGQRPVHTPAALIAFAWTLVGVPLAYGLYQTVKTALTLFTG